MEHPAILWIKNELSANEKGLDLEPDVEKQIFSHWGTQCSLDEPKLGTQVQRCQGDAAWSHLGGLSDCPRFARSSGRETIWQMTCYWS
jgi:hypothetical protein